MTSSTQRRFIFLLITALAAVILIGIPGDFALPLFAVICLAAVMAAVYRFRQPLLEKIPPRQRRITIIILVPLIPWLVFLISGMRGIDFGPRHVDEPIQLDVTIRTLQSGILVPDFYNYPSMSYWLTLAALTPELPQINSGAIDPAHFIETHRYAYMLRVRRIYLFVSSLAILWVYGAALIWRKQDQNPWLEAVAAAAILGFSREAAYHARWIAPDTILMQFGVLTLLLCMLAIRYPGQASRALTGAAIAAGLGTGSKYPGGLLILPVMIAAVPTLRKMRFYQAGWKVFGLLLAFGGAYLLTTPGTLLAPGEFLADVRYELDHYRVFGHDVHTVKPGLQHLYYNLNYLVRAGFSAYEPIAILLAVLTVIGAIAALRENLTGGLIALVFPVVYVLYFSQQRVMFIRNLLVVLPFCAILAARGAFFLMALPEKIPGKLPAVTLQYSALTVLLILLGLNANTLISDAESIRHPDEDRAFLDFVAYVNGHPDVSFAASEQVWNAFREYDLQIPRNISYQTWQTADTGAFFSNEIGLDLPPNRTDTFLRWFGSREVNYNVYPYWQGHHVMLMSRGKIAFYHLPAQPEP